MARTEKEFLTTIETYIKITQDRMKDGRIIDAYDELGLILKMTQQRLREVEDNAPWILDKEAITEKLKAWQKVPMILETNKTWEVQESQRETEEAFEAANELGEETLSHPRTKETLEALKDHPWKSHCSLGEMVERQAEGGG